MLSKTGSPFSSYSGVTRITAWPAFLNSGEITFLLEAVETANDTSVGGTSILSNVPDMESLPPIAPQPISSCAFNAPRSAEKGLPQRTGLFCVLSKYSWNVSQHFFLEPPTATTFAIDSTTASIAP